MALGSRPLFPIRRRYRFFQSPEIAGPHRWEGILLKTVLLLRHAKSSWDQPGLPDPLRPLAPRGQKAAPRIGAYMARSRILPDLVYCSTARRARATWDLVSGKLEHQTDVEVREDLYHASPGSLIELIKELPDSIGTVLLVGHNPTFEDLALALTGGGDEEGLREMAFKYPTGALAVIDFSIERWCEVRAGEGVLRTFVKPRAL
ncbi:MAG: histidine phosphatase family protein [Gemmatimonadetes bacterium]|nr:histidine phosphatase family protein [Gemmatimonadota bacterium]NNM05193.1 histidine phosphatase family protein [Gemmatimonadota bacterium]